MGMIQKAYIVPHPPIIIPEVGQGKEGPAVKTIEAYETIARQIGEIAPDVIILTTPHGTVYSDYIHISPDPILTGDLRQFGAPRPRLEFQNDEDLLASIVQKAQAAGIEAGTLGAREKHLDHGAYIPLYFIHKYTQRFKLVRISISGLSPITHYRFGALIAQAVEESGSRAVFVASGDLSHKLLDEGPYGFDPHGPVFDKKLASVIQNGDFSELLHMDERLCESAAECGLRSFIIMAGALNGKDIRSVIHSYEGPFGVGYMVAEISVEGDNSDRDYSLKEDHARRERMAEVRDHEDPYVALARRTLETYVKTGKSIDVPKDLPQDMINRRAGVFVSIKKHGQLRGCIGTIAPTAPHIAAEIISNAVQSGTADPRFNPVKENELDDLVYSVDVLGEPEPIEDMDQLDPVRYGVIVTSGYKRGLLLPNLEGVDTAQQQVEIALSKAGIRGNEKYTMERFEVVRHK